MAIRIEDKANGSAVIQLLSHEIPGLLPLNPQSGKVARAQAISPLVEAGNIYLPHPDYAPWVNDFIEECFQFPNGAHDDQVDAMTQALVRWHQPVDQTTIIPFSDLAAAYARIREGSPWVCINPV
jgi:predicted phage terminase large subunit-like protein